jgi:hypothetical protein
MRVFLIFASIIIFISMMTAVVPLALAANGSCQPVTISAEVELPAGELVLADLLAPNACSAILSAARQVHLGSVPLSGSPRVLTGDEIRGELQRLRLPEQLAAKFTPIPERVIVRRKDNYESAGVALARPAVRSLNSRALGASRALGVNEEVRAGQTVILVWDQDGIRVQVPALCLDTGATGAHVRARILRGNHVVRAIVESGKSLRMIS